MKPPSRRNCLPRCESYWRSSPHRRRPPARTTILNQPTNQQSAISNQQLWYSAQPLHDLLEGFLPGTEALQRQRGERLIAHVQLREEVVAIGLDIDETGGELA